MTYNINGINIEVIAINNYIDNRVNKIYAILGIFEDNQNKSNLKPYERYLERINKELKGAAAYLPSETWLELSNLIYGLAHTEAVTQPEVKSLVFHCIALVKKAKVEA